MMLPLTGEARDHNISNIACTHSHGHDDQLVVVRAEWNGWRSAHVRVADLEDIHWWRPVGAPRPLIHAFLSCRSVVTGDLSHSCDAKTTHRLQICILKCQVAACVFQELVARAVERHDLFRAGSLVGLEAASRLNSSSHHRLIVTSLSASLLAVTAALPWVIASTRKRAANVRVHELAGPPPRDDAIPRTTTRMSRNSCPSVCVEVPVAPIETTPRFVPAV